MVLFLFISFPFLFFHFEGNYSSIIYMYVTICVYFVATKKINNEQQQHTKMEEEETGKNCFHFLLMLPLVVVAVKQIVDSFDFIRV